MLSHHFRNPTLARPASDALRRVQSHRVGPLKMAALGGEPESSFEQSFSTLAYMHVKDKAPRLLDYLQGFQLVERNDDSTKAMGIFGFQHGKQWMYAPVFFLGDDLKGHELLYLKNQNAFVPLKENWVNYLLGKEPFTLGEAIPDTLQQLGIKQPDVRSLSIPPFFSKRSSAQRVNLPQGWQKWASEFLPTLGTLTTVPATRMAKYAKVRGLEDLLAESATACHVLQHTMQRYPQLKAACDRFYGRDLVARSLNRIRTKLASWRPQRPSLLGSWRKAAAEPAPRVRFYTEETITQNVPELAEEERERLLRDGHLVRDLREGEQLSVAYNVQHRCELINPRESGHWEVLHKPGEFRNLLVLSAPIGGYGDNHMVTVINPESKHWQNLEQRVLWAQPRTETRTELMEAIDRLGSDSKSLETGGTYVAVGYGDDGELTGSAPFEVEKDLSDGRYRVMWHTSKDRRYRCPYPDPNPTEQDLCSPCCESLGGYSDEVYLNDREGVRFRQVGGVLQVPKEFKVIKLKAAREEGSGDFKYPAHDRSSEDVVSPGDWADLQAEIAQKTARLRVAAYTDAGQLTINQGPLVSRRTALFDLIGKHGFAEPVAREIIKQAEAADRQGRPAEFYVRYGEGYPQLQKAGQSPLRDQAILAPAIPEEQLGTGYEFNGVPQRLPEEYELDIPQLAEGDPSVYDTSPEAMPDPMAMQAAQMAARSGQKEVFDTAMLAGLLRAVRPDSLVTRWMGDLMRSLDRLGRIIFQFYWHNDEFSQRYGQADLPELEDTLRNAFEVLGDLILFLKEKDVDAVPGVSMGSPDIQESALN